MKIVCCPWLSRKKALAKSNSTQRMALANGFYNTIVFVTGWRNPLEFFGSEESPDRGNPQL